MPRDSEVLLRRAGASICSYATVSQSQAARSAELVVIEKQT